MSVRSPAVGGRAHSKGVTLMEAKLVVRATGIVVLAGLIVLAGPAAHAWAQVPDPAPDEATVATPETITHQ